MAAVVISDGDSWAEQRKFMVKNLNDLGMNKSNIVQDIVWDEADILCDRMAQDKQVDVKVSSTFQST